MTQIHIVILKFRTRKVNQILCKETMIVLTDLVTKTVPYSQLSNMEF